MLYVVHYDEIILSNFGKYSFTLHCSPVISLFWSTNYNIRTYCRFRGDSLFKVTNFLTHSVSIYFSYLRAKHIKMFHTDFSYWSINKQNMKINQFFPVVPHFRPLKKWRLPKITPHDCIWLKVTTTYILIRWVSPKHWHSRTHTLIFHWSCMFFFLYLVRNLQGLLQGVP